MSVAFTTAWRTRPGARAGARSSQHQGQSGRADCPGWWGGRRQRHFLFVFARW